MACIPPSCACLVGHSFVRRMIEFIEGNQGGGFYSHIFGIYSTFTVKTIGIGGRTVDKMIKFNLQVTREVPPPDIDSNDLRDEQADPNTVALSILAWLSFF